MEKQSAQRLLPQIVRTIRQEGKRKIEIRTVINFLKRLSILLPKIKTPDGDTSSIEGVSSVNELICSSSEAIVS